MAKKQFDDPLEDIDPIMEQAFSVDESVAETAPVLTAVEDPPNMADIPAHLDSELDSSPGNIAPAPDSFEGVTDDALSLGTDNGSNHFSLDHAEDFPATMEQPLEAISDEHIPEEIFSSSDHDTAVTGTEMKRPLFPEEMAEKNHEFLDGIDHSPISDVEFPTLQNSPSGKSLEMDIFKNIPVNVSVELGRSEVSLKEVFELNEGSIIELNRLVGEPLDLVVNGQVIAQGEVVAIDNNYGLRITSIMSKADVK